MFVPEYINYFEVCFAPEFVENILRIESSFQAVNYDLHVDLIENIFMQEGTMEMRTLCDEAILIYRNHIADMLFMQGFTLTNSDDVSLGILSKIVMGVSVIARTDVATITEGEMISDAETDLEMVCNLLAITSTIPAVELLFYISEVNPYIVDLIKAGENTEEYRNVNKQKFQARFLEKREVGVDGLVVAEIRNMNYFGYNAETMLNLIADRLEEITDAAIIRKELLLLIAGSNLNSVEDIEQFLDTSVNSLFHNTQLIMKINSQWPNFESWIK